MTFPLARFARKGRGHPQSAPPRPRVTYLAPAIFAKNAYVVIGNFIADRSEAELCTFQANNADIFDVLQWPAIGYITHEKL